MGAIEMKFLVALAVLTVVGAHATSDIVVKVEVEELSSLLRTFCCGSVQQRCARACTGRSCSLRCQGYCGSSIAGVVPTPAPQSPTLANQQPQQPQQPQRLLLPQQLTRLLVVQQPQTVPLQLEVKQLLVVTPQLVTTPQLVELLLLLLVLHLEMLPQPAVKQQLALLLQLNQLLNA